jgi:predicted nucleic acid-binding protein
LRKLAERTTIFVDVNIFIDVMSKRAGWQDSLTLLNSVREGTISGHISTLTSAIIYFVRSRFVSPEIAREEVSKSTKQFSAVSLTAEIVDSALKEGRIKDLEDAIQFHSCIPVAKILITRNKRDYSAVEKEVEILTPEEFLDKFCT